MKAFQMAPERINVIPKCLMYFTLLKAFIVFKAFIKALHFVSDFKMPFKLSLYLKLSASIKALHFVSSFKNVHKAFTV